MSLKPVLQNENHTAQQWCPSITENLGGDSIEDHIHVWAGSALPTESHWTQVWKPMAITEDLFQTEHSTTGFLAGLLWSGPLLYHWEEKSVNHLCWSWQEYCQVQHEAMFHHRVWAVGNHTSMSHQVLLQVNLDSRQYRILLKTWILLSCRFLLNLYFKYKYSHDIHYKFSKI